jgi:hypothetical protein
VSDHGIFEFRNINTAMKIVTDSTNEVETHGNSYPSHPTEI